MSQPRRPSRDENRRGPAFSPPARISGFAPHRVFHRAHPRRLFPFLAFGDLRRRAGLANRRFLLTHKRREKFTFGGIPGRVFALDCCGVDHGPVLFRPLILLPCGIPARRLADFARAPRGPSRDGHARLCMPPKPLPLGSANRPTVGRAWLTGVSARSAGWIEFRPCCGGVCICDFGPTPSVAGFCSELLIRGGCRSRLLAYGPDRIFANTIFLVGPIIGGGGHFTLGPVRLIGGTCSARLLNIRPTRDAGLCGQGATGY